MKLSHVKTVPRKYDVLIAISVSLQCSAILVTMLVLSLTTTLTGATISQAVAVIESNPLMRLAVDIRNFGNAGVMLLIPAALLAFYHASKNALYRYNPVVLQMFVWILFYASLFDIMNDIGAWLGLLARMGVTL